MLSLDGTTLKLNDMSIGLSMELKDQDMSGQSSSTEYAEQGDKGKKLSINGNLPFSSSDTLTTLYQLASEKDENDNRKVYRVANDLAKSLKIRQVKFTGNINATEHDTLNAWRVSFELREYNGVAEQKENRAKQNTETQQTQNTRLQQALLEAEDTGL